MIQTAQRQCTRGTSNIGHNIVEIKDPAIGEETLEEFGADSKDTGADEEGKVEGPSPRGIEDPVEAGGEEKKGEAMEDLVVDYGVDLEGGEPSVGRDSEKEEKGACIMSVGTTWAEIWTSGGRVWETHLRREALSAY